MPAIKLKQSFVDKNRVSFAHSNRTNAAKSAQSNGGKAASSPAQFKENQCGSMGLGTGPRLHEDCPFSSVNHVYAATGEAALEATVAAAYKQVFGNIGVTSNQRLASLEAFLRDGRIDVRGFVAGLVKSELYKNKFFHAVAPMRGVELTTRHLLGRAPRAQQEVSAAIQLIADQGFDAFVDQLVTSEEYLETFGVDTVPYLRGFKSEARSYCSTFVGTVELTPANASSENSMYSGSLLVKMLNKGSTVAAPAFTGDGSDFVYSKAVGQASNAAFRRMYGGKFSYRY